MNNKKKVLVTAVAVCLIAILSFSTLAWFNAQDSAKNDFYITDSKENANDIFSVDVWEYTDGDTTTPVQRDEFKDITPGLTVHKQPYVENTGVYDQYVRVTITISDASNWNEAIEAKMMSDVSALIVGFNTAAWGELKFEQKGTDYVAVCYLNTILTAEAEPVMLFDHVKFPDLLTEQEMDFVGGSFSIDILAEAVQADNLPSDIDTAEEAFYMVETTYNQDIQ